MWHFSHELCLPHVSKFYRWSWKGVWFAVARTIWGGLLAKCLADSVLLQRLEIYWFSTEGKTWTSSIDLGCSAVHTDYSCKEGVLSPWPIIFPGNVMVQQVLLSCDKCCLMPKSWKWKMVFSNFFYMFTSFCSFEVLVMSGMYSKCLSI